MFTGFPQDALVFLSELAENNNKPWFEENKPRYKRNILEPAVAFVEAFGERMQALQPTISYDTRANGSGSLMRIYRDVRFSKDKSPYKTAIAGLIWEGENKKTAPSSFGFQLTGNSFDLMGGTFGFGKTGLSQYRDAVNDEDLGESLIEIISTLEAGGKFRIEAEHYKTTPRGYPNDHPRARFLKFNRLYAAPTEKIDPAIIHTPELVDLAVTRLEPILPLHRWLVSALQ